MTETDLALSQAYFAWQNKYYEFQDSDRLIEPYLKIAQNGPSLKQAREAQFLTVERAATKQGISRTAYVGFEKRALNGDITLNTLKAAASAIDCEFVYAIRPQSKMAFSMAIWQRVLPLVLRDQTITNLRWYYRAQAMATLAHKIINDAEFRRSQGWSERGINEWAAIRDINHQRFLRLKN